MPTPEEIDQGTALFIEHLAARLVQTAPDQADEFTEGIDRSIRMAAASSPPEYAARSFGRFLAARLRESVGQALRPRTEGAPPSLPDQVPHEPEFERPSDPPRPDL